MNSSVFSSYFGGVFDWIVELTFGGTVVLITAIAVSHLAKGKRASLRHAIWVACMALLVAIPAMLTLLPRFDLQLEHFMPTAVSEKASEQTLDRRFFATNPHGNELAPLAAATTSNENPTGLIDLIRSVDRSASVIDAPLPNTGANEPTWWNSQTRSASVSTIWSLGAFILLLRLGVASVWIRRLVKRSAHATGLPVEREANALARSIGLCGKIRLRISPPGLMPMIVGVVRPVLLIPESVLGRESDDRRAVLLHELGHLKRRDPLSHFIGELAGALFWFHPLYWFARRQCCALREEACDDLVLRSETCPVVYARCLVSVASSNSASGVLSVMGIAMSTRRIERRLRAILCDSADRRPLGRQLQAAIILAAMTFCVPVVMIRAEPQNQLQIAEPQRDRITGDALETDAPATDAPATDAPAESGQSVSKSVPEAEQAAEPETDKAAKEAEQLVQRDATGSRVVSGTVLNHSGSPIEGARILTRSWNSKDKSEINASVQTAADGTFTLEFAETHSAERDMYPIWVWAEGHQVQAALLAWLFGDQDHVRNVNFQLPKAKPTHYTILKPDGQPLPNARLIPEYVRTCQGVFVDGRFAIDETAGGSFSVSSDGELAKILGVTSDEEGHATLANLPQNLFDSVLVISQEFGTQRFAAQSSTHELRLSEVGEIRGRVQIDDPSQIAGTKFLLKTRSYFRPGGPLGGEAEVRLDNNGCFHVPALAATRDAMFVYTYEWNEELDVHPFLDRKVRRQLHAGEVLDLTIETVPTVLVHGRVLTADTREPVVGAKAFLNCLSSPINGVRDLTDEDGRFSVRVAPGPILQQVTSMGSDRSLYEKYDYPRLDRIEIPKDVEEFELEPFLLTPKQIVQGVVCGQVRDAIGDPIANKTLVFHYRERGRIIARTTTDEHGQFSVAVRDWNIIHETPTRAARCGWSILENETRIENGYQKRELTPLEVVDNDADAMLLVRP
ncbi:hypothetical protein FYK55_14355 [Roseiconus nitratireducens]|uniref:Peptidase M56 domain-containing protein n=1 Tax=Roseiconus nitratireducens TaxID=2605748 RepID=A0A5M6D5B5_9BACT|nr:M56 family metallopeptidase [Roseiconus nitratireducens]KAA5542707.1 hypothetical protein FYK55_14355 [Roseiconus nitratireducens]